jgi:hypothetical protein
MTLVTDPNLILSAESGYRYLCPTIEAIDAHLTGLTKRLAAGKCSSALARNLRDDRDLLLELRWLRTPEKQEP